MIRRHTKRKTETTVTNEIGSPLAMLLSDWPTITSVARDRGRCVVRLFPTAATRLRQPRQHGGYLRVIRRPRRKNTEERNKMGDSTSVWREENVDQAKTMKCSYISLRKSSRTDSQHVYVNRLGVDRETASTRQRRWDWEEHSSSR